MRAKIERNILIALLAISYVSRAPGLIRQGWIGVPALVLGFVFAAVLIIVLLGRSPQGALFIALLAALGAIFVLVGQFIVWPMLFGVHSLPMSEIALSIGVSLAALFCAIDLWRQWKDLPTKSPPPIPASVIPAAGAPVTPPVGAADR